jgi:hypothetical protein
MITQSHIARIIKGPHLLYVGGNGVKTFGITVEALEHDPKSGYSKTWDENDHTIHKPNCQYAFGLTDDEYKKLVAEIDKLTIENNLISPQ